ncbi:uncharacterized protein BXZ73DRAFT_73515 [Epithele typhae]|uniref:uncharacterized protein n=1 Tax=Epithele typhae TaxID=378194 RepID=UPI0020086670|nr:uncharacterized protein BXZ73DRAFT_73515 [Epithele typhae]KAH9945356.1 hypothetical protein BXZ73DRAFT_73515 [Epithele typhae]
MSHSSRVASFASVHQGTYEASLDIANPRHPTYQQPELFNVTPFPGSAIMPDVQFDPQVASHAADADLRSLEREGLDCPANCSTVYNSEQELRHALGLNYDEPISLSLLSPTWPDTYTLPLLAQLAILGSPGRRLTVRELYDALTSFREKGDDKWRRSLRHALSLHSIFQNVRRPPTAQGRGGYWTVDYSRAHEKKQRKRRAKGSQKAPAQEELPSASRINELSASLEDNGRRVGEDGPRSYKTRRHSRLDVPPYIAHKSRQVHSSRRAPDPRTAQPPTPRQRQAHRRYRSPAEETFAALMESGRLLQMPASSSPLAAPQPLRPSAPWSHIGRHHDYAAGELDQGTLSQEAFRVPDASQYQYQQHYYPPMPRLQGYDEAHHDQHAAYNQHHEQHESRSEQQSHSDADAGAGRTYRNGQSSSARAPGQVDERSGSHPEFVQGSSRRTWH